MADAAIHHAEHGHHTSTGLSNNKLGMWLFLGSECLLFGGLISTYMIYRGRVGEGPRPGGQVYEFTAMYNEGLGFTTSLFGSAFYTLTGFHGVHVTVGVIMLLSLVGIIKRSRVPGDKAEVVELVGLYWHFVDVVWIIIFTLVYLIPT